ncbi:MAG: IS4 family transposase [Cyanobacteriota bacterium]
MLPEPYQKILKANLTESQYITICLLILLIQNHRQVKLSTLASVFPQPIHYDSRRKSLKRFLSLPKVSLKLLWLPLIKYWIRQVEGGKGLNREQRRYQMRLKSKSQGYWILAIDRTEWKKRNILMVTVIWGTHALPIYWELLDARGACSIQVQKRLLKKVLPLFKTRSIIVVGDKEFHSPHLAQWLQSRNVYFALRQKKSLHFQENLGEEYKILKEQDFKPGMSKFYQGIYCNKGDGLGSFNLAVYWKRKYRQKAPKDPWYILTNLPSLKKTLAIYRCRWGIEQFFKDCKSGGYNLEDTRVNDTRFMALLLIIVLSYSITTLHGQWLQRANLDMYAGRLQEESDKYPKHSSFSLALYGQRWRVAMEIWSDLALQLILLKPHKALFFQRGLHALSLIQQGF